MKPALVSTGMRSTCMMCSTTMPAVSQAINATTWNIILLVASMRCRRRFSASSAVSPNKRGTRTRQNDVGWSRLRLAILRTSRRSTLRARRVRIHVARSTPIAAAGPCEEDVEGLVRRDGLVSRHAGGPNGRIRADRADRADGAQIGGSGGDGGDVHPFRLPPRPADRASMRRVPPRRRSELRAVSRPVRAARAGSPARSASDIRRSSCGRRRSSATSWPVLPAWPLVPSSAASAPLSGTPRRADRHAG